MYASEQREKKMEEAQKEAARFQEFAGTLDEVLGLNGNNATQPITCAQSPGETNPDTEANDDRMIPNTCAQSPGDTTCLQNDPTSPARDMFGIPVEEASSEEADYEDEEFNMEFSNDAKTVPTMEVEDSSNDLLRAQSPQEPDETNAYPYVMISAKDAMAYLEDVATGVVRTDPTLTKQACNILSEAGQKVIDEAGPKNEEPEPQPNDMIIDEGIDEPIKKAAMTYC